MGYNWSILRFQIINMSKADNWEDAKLEWHVDDIQREEPQICLCTHDPIIEICYIANDLTGETTEVGNCCVKNFMADAKSGSMFASVNRVRKKEDAALSPKVIEIAFRHARITEWERDFYIETSRKRLLSARQRARRVQINKKVLESMVFEKEKE